MHKLPDSAFVAAALLLSAFSYLLLAYHVSRL